MGRWLLIGASCIGGLLSPITGAAFANTITVANSHDSGTGSLRAAIAAADPGDTIDVPSGIGEIQLASELEVSKSITIEGAGSGRPQVNGTSTTRVLHIDGGATVTISDLLISGGHAVAPGGDAFGGGIFVHGASLTLSNSIVTQDVADVRGGGSGGMAAGGGIAADTATSSLTLVGTTVSDDQVLGQNGSNAWGGGIFDTGSLVIRGGSVEGNTSDISGGGSISGGGIMYYDTTGSTTATIENVSISQNAAEETVGQGGYGDGGGLFASGGNKTALTNVTVANNFLNMNGGQSNDNGGIAEGAGLYIAGVPQASVVNATVTGNTATANSSGTGQGGGVYGAGLAGPGTELFVTNSTISGNGGTATGPAGSVNGGNAWTTSGNIFFENSIVAAGLATPGTANCSGGAAIVSHGHNIDSLDQCGFHGAGDQVGTDPALRPLGDNGGPVHTLALAPGSHAIDAGDATACPLTDARGVLRPAGAACDVGAFEVATPTAVTGAASGVGGTAATLNGTARNPDLAPATVTFEYGTSTSYGSSTAAKPIAATTAGAPFNVTIAALIPNTTYHFREVVTNAVGTSVGGDQTFTTARASIPPGGGPEATVTGNGLRFTVACAPGASCRIHAVATTVEKLRGHKVVALASRLHRRKVVVASAIITIAGGQRRTITLKLNKIGRRLEARFKHLPVTVTITLKEADGKTVLVAVVHVTLKRRR